MDLVTPSRVGPFGGGVLLLHGTGLPFLSLQRRLASIFVGEVTCPFLPRRSDPRGAFLACAIPPPARNVTGETAVNVTIRGGDSKLGCLRCRLVYSADLRAAATLLLSNRRGAAGDVVTLLGVGEWPLLAASRGMHEQVEATLGGYPALPRHPSSTAVSRSPPRWRIELAVPHMTAGQHALRVALDWLWREEEEIHGTVSIDHRSHAFVTVLPALREIVRPARGRLIWLRGSGFSAFQAHNVVTFDGVACAVRTASMTSLSCELGRQDGTPGRVTPPPSPPLPPLATQVPATAPGIRDLLALF